MDVRLVDGGLDQRSGTALLPPSGTQTYGFWVQNTGDGTDQAVFDVSGLEGIATREITLYGLPIDGEITIPAGYGIWDQNNSAFLLDASNEPIIGSTEDATEAKICDLGYCGGGYEALPFEMYFEIELNVNPGASTGEGGILELVVLSTKNAANRAGHFDISLDVQIIYQFEFDLEGLDTELEVFYPKTKEFTINLTNTGNTDAEVLVFSSESFRGWSVVLDEVEGTDTCSLEIKDFICDIEVGQTIGITVTVRTPSGAEIADTFKFTISAEPLETGVVDRENVELEIRGEPSKGLLGLGLSNEQIQTGFLALVLIPFLVIFYTAGKSQLKQKSGANRNKKEQQ